MKRNLTLSIQFGFLFLILIISKTEVYAQNGTCNSLAPAIYTLTANADGEIYIPSAAARGWKGGDTVRISAGNYTLIEIGNFKGDPCRPIVIINYGGQVIAENIRFGNDASYFKIVGIGTTGIEYGFKVQPTAGIGVAIGLAHHVEVSNIEVINPNDLGFFFKINPNTSDPRTLYNDYRMTKFYIHHNYLHNIGGEGMYIGHSAPNGDGTTGQLVPIRMDSVEIAYNIVDGTDWDGIQLANARYGCSIHHNNVSNYGRSNLGSQQGGILMGSNTNGDIYNNTITSGTGNGIQVFGYGNINVYNNTMENCGVDFTSSGQESFFSNDYLSTIEINPVQTISFTNNVIKFPSPKGGIKIGSYNSNSGPANISNNQFCIPGASGNWQSSYISSNAPNTTISNNILLTDCANTNKIPIANAGNDQMITLPINTVTVNGSGSDPDGTITSYLWTKISGPVASSITNANNASTTITGLTAGTYQFELKVTDNLGSVGKDTIIITVNAAPNVKPTANAGADQSITLPTNSVTLNGAGTDTDGSIASYLWTKISGPAANSITNASNASTTVTGLIDGTYQFELKVTDNIGATGKDTVNIIVNAALNKAPIADAGSDQTITLPVNSVKIIGNGIDTDGSVASYFWREIQGPTSATIVDPLNPSTSITNLDKGDYVFELIVTDNQGLIAKDTMVVHAIVISPKNNSLTIAPTITNNTINLKFEFINANQIFQYQIFDMRGILKYTSGKQIAPYNVVSLVMNVSSFSKGYYVIAVNIGGKKNIIGRFIKA